MKYTLPVLLCIVFLLMSAPVYALQFDQTYSITYVFDDRGNASVSKKVTLTNLDENIYPSEYTLDIPEDATKIAAFDQMGKLELEIGHKENKKLAKLILNSQNIGISNNTEIALIYETRQLVRGTGTERVITIPPLLSSESLTLATVSVELPEAWGEPSTIVPEPEIPYMWKNSQAVGGIQIRYGGNPKPTTSHTPAPTHQAARTPESFKPFLGLIVGSSIVGLGFILLKLLHKT